MTATLGQDTGGHLDSRRRRLVDPAFLRGLPHGRTGGRAEPSRHERREVKAGRRRGVA
jgi:hypothetical protein